jgi:hypothetical protein
MAKDVEHFFMDLLAICTSFENCLFNLIACLLTGLLVLWNSLYIEDINPLEEP